MNSRYHVVDSVDIMARPEVVWRELVDELGGAAEWWNERNVFIPADPSRPADLIGTRINVEVHPTGVDKPGPVLRFGARTSRVEPHRLLALHYDSGAFDGSGVFELQPIGEGTRLSMEFSASPRGWVRWLARVTDIGAEHSAGTRAAFQRLRARHGETVDDPGAEEDYSLLATGRGLAGRERRTVVAADGARLAATRYEPLSPLSRGAVVLVHGWGGTAGSWRSVVDVLLSHGLVVVTMDLRGHGESERGTAAVELDLLVSDLSAVLTAFEVRESVLVGHSGGGLVSILLAQEGLHQVNGLVLVGTGARDQGAGAAELALLGSPLLNGLLRRPLLAGRLLDRTMGPVPPGAQARTAKALADTSARTRREFFQASRDVDILPEAAQLRVPTVVLRGDEDRVVPRACVAQTARVIRGAELVTLPGLGHALPEAAGLDVAQAVLAVVGS